MNFIWFDATLGGDQKIKQFIDVKYSNLQCPYLTQLGSGSFFSVLNLILRQDGWHFSAFLLPVLVKNNPATVLKQTETTGELRLVRSIVT